MKNLFISILSVSVLACTVLSSCTSGDTNNQQNTQQPKDSSQKEEILDPNRGALVKVNNRLFNVPSPIQLASVIKKIDLPYNQELLNRVDKRQNYTTSFKQALNIGIYGANLGYINVFEQLPDAAAYFAAIRTLSQDLGIMNSFNEETMKRIERNNGNKDSLLYIASIMYRESDSYLMNSDRNEVGALIIAGGWVEGLYLLTHIAPAKDLNPEIIEMIGQQKCPLNNLIDLLRPYYGKLTTEYDSFVEELSDLAAIFDDIQIKYTFKPSVTEEDKKITYINSETEAVIDVQHIETISKKIEKLRNKITD
ncbi:MAG: hypothetical protein MJ211_01260 [Bacteroidales bacterium]|nr:hypothetical protein [Bacteroidales bacterium]